VLKENKYILLGYKKIFTNKKSKYLFWNKKNKIGKLVRIFERNFILRGLEKF
jgi:hypothetical protein